jgi:hypothetical protein
MLLVLYDYFPLFEKLPFISYCPGPGVSRLEPSINADLFNFCLLSLKTFISNDSWILDFAS